MPVLRGRRFSELSPLRIGTVAVVGLVTAVLLALNSGGIYRSLAATGYSAEFTEAGGLKSGDEVRLGGVIVGKVGSVAIRAGRVVADFTVEGAGRLGQETGATIKTATPLGTKFLSVVPAGPGVLEPGAVIPVTRTTSPYDVQDLLDQLGSVTGKIDLPQLGQALSVTAETFRDTPDDLRPALAGLSRLSQTLASRDTALRDLLRNANGVTGVLAQRSGQLATLMSDGNLLLDELYRRRETIRSLLDGVTAVLTQLRGVVADNQAQIGPALEQLQATLDLLNDNDKNIAATIEGFKTYAGSLGEAVASGPWFFALVPNLAPTNLVQQTLPSLVTAAQPASPSLGGVVPR